MDKKSTNIAGTAEPASNSSPDAPAQPVVTVVETPAGVPGSTTAAETMPATDPATGAPVDTVVLVKPPKKKKTGLIVGIIIIILLLLGGIGFAIWYFAVYQFPENVVFDSVNKLITAEHVSPHGSFTTTISEDDYTYNLTFNLESSSRRLPNETNLSLLLGITDSKGEPLTDEAIKLNLGAVQLVDGVIYFKFSQLADAFEQIHSARINTVCSNPLVDCVDAMSEFELALYDIIEVVDDEWWQISLADILDEIDMFEDWQADAFKDMYSCVLSAANSNYSPELAKLYREYRFLNFETISSEPTRPEGTTGYVVTLDYDAFAGFLNSVKTTDAAESFYTCYNSALDTAYAKADDHEYDKEDLAEAKLSADDFDDITTSDLKEIFSDDFITTLYIDTWSHELREFIAFPRLNDEKLAISVAFDYSIQPVAEAPAEYRPVSELFEEVIEIVVELFSEDEDAPELPGLDFPIEIGV